MRINTEQALGIRGVFGLFLILLHWAWDLVPYVFYVRLSLLAGALLVCLPVLCIYLLPSLLGNPFVLSNKWGLDLIIPASAVTGLGVVLVRGIIARKGARMKSAAIVSLLAGVFTVGSMPVARADDAHGWPMYGRDKRPSFAQTDTAVRAANAATLVPVWTFTPGERGG